MIRQALLAVVVCLAASHAVAAPRPASPKGKCEATARGARGDNVHVVLTLDAGNRVESRLAYWNPPTPDDADTKALHDAGKPGLSVVYHPTADGMLGPVAMIMVFASPVPASAQSLQAGGTALDFDGRTWRRSSVAVSLGPESLVTSLFVTGNAQQPDSADVFQSLESARLARADIFANDALITSQAYDVADKASRDSLFRQAWGEATAKALTPEVCRRPASPPGTKR